MTTKIICPKCQGHFTKRFAKPGHVVNCAYCKTKLKLTSDMIQHIVPIAIHTGTEKFKPKAWYM